MRTAADGFALLVAAVRSQLGSAPTEFAAVPDQGAWEALPALARLHRLSGVVARAARADFALPTPPAAVASRLRDDAVGTAAMALAALVPMQDAVRALEAAGIPVLVWKGPALAVAAWGDVGMRSSVDIDLVVAPADRARARAIVGGLGWAPAHAMTAAQETAIHAGRGAWELRHPAHRVSLEVHWEFSALRYPGRLAVREVLGRAARLPVGGLEVRVPSPADTLVLLAQHGSKHGWGSLDDVAVFAAIRARNPDALPEALVRARSVGAERALSLALALGDRVLRSTFAGAETHAAALTALLAEVEGRLRSGDVAWRPTLRWDLAWTPRARDRWRLVWRTLFDPTLQEWFAVRLPGPLVPLYRLIRPVRLLVRGRGA